VNAVGGGIPIFCASPTATAVADGRWSAPATWSSGAVPSAGAKVLIPAGRQVAYDAESASAVQCVEVRGQLAFDTGRNTKLTVVTLIVMEEGLLEVGSEERPVAAAARAEIVIADRPFDYALDPGQVGNGIIGLGRIRMHGADKMPTFARLTGDARASQTTFTLDRPLQGWAAGDRIVFPDTRQLREQERGRAFTSRDEQVEIAAVDGATITIRTPLAWDHPAAHGTAGAAALRPHVGNLSRNVVVASERPSGTRGHMIFLARADVDLRYVEVRDMGRTTNSAIDSTTFDGAGRAVRVGFNQIGRYAIHFHHNFGPAARPRPERSRRPGGQQFTLIGNAVVAPAKWGITIHNTHFGLVRDNVVYNSRGASIVTEDGNESFNVFDHNFAVRSQGAGDSVPRGGYDGGGSDPGSEGSAFWFSGPNNYVRNNVAANADSFGFSLAGPAGEMRVPGAAGADMLRAAETRSFDPVSAPVLEFSNNEAYGAMQIGVDCNWNGVISNVTVWHAARNGLVGMPASRLVIDGLVARGEPAILADAQENPSGVWLGNYIGREIVVRNADVEGLRTGVSSPFVSGPLGGGRTVNPGSVVIEQSRFRNYFGVVVGTAYAPAVPGGRPDRVAVVRSSSFEPLPGVPVNPASPPAAISMNYRMAPGDAAPREPILVQDFNNKPGETFKVYYSLEAPPAVAPCHESRPDIGGWVCH
jgi:G8 domain